jgi:hypothetical protein
MYLHKYLEKQFLAKYSYMIDTIKLISEVITYEINCERTLVNNQRNCDATSWIFLVHGQYVVSFGKDYGCAITISNRGEPEYQLF